MTGVQKRMSGADYLLSTGAIRDRTNLIFELAKSGKTHFLVNEDKLSNASDVVIDVIKENYPSLEVPYHSRWRHFVGDGGALLSQFNRKLENLSEAEKAAARTDLIVLSVLVDAGAGEAWSYSLANGKTIGRSEGLALASLAWVLSGELSDDMSPTVSAKRLSAIHAENIKSSFQVSDENPLKGVEGRAALLNRLGRAVLSNPEAFPTGHPGDLAASWIRPENEAVSALEIFEKLLDAFGAIWPGRLAIGCANLGDTWAYPELGEGEQGYVPFHKLTQWLTYSMIETLEMSGTRVVDVEKLTGLAEYRNGGLFLDSDVIALRNPALALSAYTPDAPIIVEWRALTITLLDLIAEQIRNKLGLTQSDFPLARVLEGGTWLAGRKLAGELRPDGGPPIALQSDGTVF